MADLNIQKKKSKKPLLWTVLALLALLAVALIIWAVADDNEDEDYVENEEIVAEPATRENESGASGYNLDSDAQEAIDQFDSFTADLGAIEIDHETSHKGITLLADALAALSTNRQNEVEELRQQADELLKNPMSDEHAGIIRDAFVTVANIIEKQTANTDAVAAESSEVTEAAQAVDGDVLVTNQKDAVKNFFYKAANALNNLE